MGVKNFANKSFATRLASGIVLVALLILGLTVGGSFAGGRILFFANLILSLIAMYELYKAIEVHKTILAYTGYLFIIIYYVLLYFDQYNVALVAGKDIHGKRFMMILMVGFLIVLFAEYVFTYPKFKMKHVAEVFMCMVYGGVMLSYLYITRMEGSKLLADGSMKDGVGLYSVWLIFIASWGCDTCAYLAGVAFGKHKMAPVLSPKKSIEGAIGGILGAAALGAIYAAIFSDKIDLPYPVPMFAIICAVAGFISMIGDLAASAIKRNHDIKDYGRIIPGHGGIMDRFDSVIYVAPVIWILVYLTTYVLK